MSFLNINKDTIPLIISGAIGFASCCTSIVSCHVMKQQNHIYEEQTEIQKLQNQPTFEIHTYLQQDSLSRDYQTEILEVRNTGARMTSCKISTTVFFALSTQQSTARDTIYAEVPSYFMINVPNSNDKGVIEKRWCPDNNRVFSKLYDASLCDCHGETYYSFDKIILVKIEYKDIMKESHVVFFNGKSEIEENEYAHYFNASKQIFGEHFFSLNHINYNYLKLILESRIKSL